MSLFERFRLNRAVKKSIEAAKKRVDENPEAVARKKRLSQEIDDSVKADLWAVINKRLAGENLEREGLF